jgi:hypothetical protein
VWQWWVQKQLLGELTNERELGMVMSREYLGK